MRVGFNKRITEVLEQTEVLIELKRGNNRIVWYFDPDRSPNN